MKLSVNDRQLVLDRPHIMGILNTTPDSFSDGGRYFTLESVMQRAEEMVAANVSIIDIGGESTRPGAAEVTEEEELCRVIPAIKALRQRYPHIWISIDTSKANVMKEAIAAGADIINDIRSLTEPNALEVAAKAQVPVCIMHMQGSPKTMQHNPSYYDVVHEVLDWLKQRVEVCLQAGIKRENIIIDPGFGFGKNLEHNYQLLAHFEQFQQLGLPVLAGMSRKSMLFKLLDKAPAECVVSSVTCASIAAMKGAHILRVHDVVETQEALAVIQKLNQVTHSME